MLLLKLGNVSLSTQYHLGEDVGEIDSDGWDLLGII